ncbi:MAG: hypothetical protein AAGH15_23320, partial [Myxococcota bacterium]
MREGAAPVDVADGEEAGHARAKHAVRLEEPARVRLEADGLEADGVRVRRPADREQQIRALERAPIRERQPYARLRLRDAGAREDLDALVAEERQYAPRDVLVLAVEHALRALDDRHPRAEAAEDLGELEPDVGAAQDEQVLGSSLEEERLVAGKVAHDGEAL